MTDRSPPPDPDALSRAAIAIVRLLPPDALQRVTRDADAATFLWWGITGHVRTRGKPALRRKPAK